MRKKNDTPVISDRFNRYRIMWVLVLFDLPTDDEELRKAYSAFRKKLQRDGFARFQYSVYMRHCPSREHADAHIKYVSTIVPEKGHVGVLCITDKQFGMMQIFYGKKKDNNSRNDHGEQLLMF